MTPSIRMGPSLRLCRCFMAISRGHGHPLGPPWRSRSSCGVLLSQLASLNSVHHSWAVLLARLRGDSVHFLQREPLVSRSAKVTNQVRGLWLASGLSAAPLHTCLTRDRCGPQRNARSRDALYPQLGLRATDCLRPSDAQVKDRRTT
ncbi:uncharacterized protein SCHCODRAFT_02127253 [Schizophyllum commune H4-8]|uniref:uncharacterized protein n=1 Tax=Schizophyllum commune (strain H4-8 / FGSC 9210) TaxID=578458 RepID=UPI0021602ACE|nr:uncharacterized protein SCHCODRAFT_02127253 [Schizophyllum commune H4-8]KAI5885402.1 hypothetical protein SCHCODRAFT_02127253 [Schizophyllum commune H4-8]